MDLCLSLLKDELPYPSELFHPEQTMTIGRYEFFQPGKTLSSEPVYLVRAEDLLCDPESLRGLKFICIGRPAETYLEASLPLLKLPSDIDVFDLANELSCIFQKYHDLEKNLTDAIQAGRGINEIIEIMMPFVQNEIVIADSNHLILANSSEQNRLLGAPELEMNKDRNIVPVEVISFFANNKRWVETKTETKPFIYDEGIFSHRLLCMNIIRDVSFSYRVMLIEKSHPFRSYDALLLAFFSEYVKRVYEHSLAGRETHELNNLADTLRMTLSGVEVESWRILHGLSVMNYTEDSRFLCLCIRPRYWDDSENTVSYYSEQITRLFRSVVTFEFHGDIVCFVNTDAYRSSQDVFLQAITPFIRDSNFRVGVSEPFKDVMRFTDYYKQAEIALTFGVEKTPSQWVHRFQEQAVDYIVKQASRETGIKALCAEKILTLHDYDMSNDASYVKTIECFFENNLNTMRTASALGIHRATMVYRLKRVEELAGISFGDPAQNLFFYLSIKLMNLMEK